MAVRKHPAKPEWEKGLAMAARLRNRLVNHIMADAFTEPPPAPEPDPEAPPVKPKKSPLMTDSQVHACLGLLKKYMPDLKSVEHKGNPNHPVVHEIRRVIIDPTHTADSAGVSAASTTE